MAAEYQKLSEEDNGESRVFTQQHARDERLDARMRAVYFGLIAFALFITLSYGFIIHFDNKDKYDVVGGIKHIKSLNASSFKGSDAQLQKLVTNMYNADSDKAQAGDITLNWGNKIHGEGDTSDQPLFTHVNEALFQKPIYAKLIEIYNDNLFHPSVCTAEPKNEGARKAQLQAYLQLLTATPVYKLAHDYLDSLGKAPTDDELFALWFGTYSRCHSTQGSSGWEHVYSGEWKGEEIDGQHNWVRYYLLEKAGQINYHGYFSHENDLIGSFQYKWNDYLKREGGFFISTSPAFDLAIFTTCVLAHSGHSGCTFQLDGNYVAITSFHQKCNAGTCLSTSYPSDH
uniref:Endoribonuclease n=1 Tax=Panagrellus redivivus TaxID=6233 RepID=A0A7E4V240_PANRE